MSHPNFYKQLITHSEKKIVMLIMDGLGGLPQTPQGKTELETAHTPHLNALAEWSALGLSSPAGTGITVGSGPGHLALFGYDPIENDIGRGALEALGVNFDLHSEDIAARGNFCTIDGLGRVTDRRGGRIPTTEAVRLASILHTIQIDGAEFFVLPVKEHRLAFVMRGIHSSGALSASDPLKTGIETIPVTALDPTAELGAAILNQFLTKAREALADESPSNMITLRGFGKLPTLPTFGEMFGLHAASIAVNGMYKGVSRLAGMDILDVDGIEFHDEIRTLEENWNRYDFFYIHYKKTDTCGENGDFDGKVAAIEEVDALIPRIMALKPDVVIVSGDHSSPAVMKSHSWHPVPTLIYSPFVRADRISEFGESACRQGSLGVFPATHIMPLALANAGKISKYGA